MIDLLQEPNVGLSHGITSSLCWNCLLHKLLRVYLLGTSDPDSSVLYRKRGLLPREHGGRQIGEAPLLSLLPSSAFPPLLPLIWLKGKSIKDLLEQVLGNVYINRHRRTQLVEVQGGTLSFHTITTVVKM